MERAYQTSRSEEYGNAGRTKNKGCTIILNYGTAPVHFKLNNIIS